LAWTIGVEMTFYAVLPLYAWALGRAGRAGSDHAQIMRWELLGLAALVVMSIGWRWYLYERPHSIGFYAFQMPQWLPGMADYFAGGMLLAVLTVWYSHRGEPRWARSRFMPAVAWVVAWGAFATYVEVISLRTGRNGEGTFERLMHHQLFLVFAVALCVPAAFGEQGRGWIRRMLESRVLNRLALISFGVYLYHQAVIGWVYDVMGAERGMFTIEFPHGPDWPFWLMLTLSLAATCVMATGSYLFVEAPFLRRKHRPPKVPTAERSSAPVREA
jgi:peptidoglycan/LPS O-acetylase OafA/YrhL